MKIILSFFLIANLYGKEFNKEIYDSALKTIKEKSFYKLDDSEIYKAALQGVLKYLDQKHHPKPHHEDINKLLSAESIKQMQTEMKGEISGIGIGIKYEPEKGSKYPLIINVIENGGADKAGLKEGDQILKIGDTATTDFSSFKDMVYKIRGKSGTSINLKVLRNGDTFSKRVRRKKITWNAMDVLESNKKFSIIKINYFNEKTTPALETALKEARGKNAKAVIFDLRDNTGGLFEEGLKAIKLFAKKDQQVLKVKRTDTGEKVYKAKKDGLGTGLKVIALISSKTASMGEAFARSLKLFNSATLIGEPSFGKGSMETLVELKNKHAVKFTIGKVYDGENNTWHEVGVSPDIYLPRSKAGEDDHQLKLAKKLL